MGSVIDRVSTGVLGNNRFKNKRYLSLNILNYYKRYIFNLAQQGTLRYLQKANDILYTVSRACRIHIAHVYTA